ncbi:erythrocyte binding like protein 1, putative [Plasmodium sp. gorilla clade G2]|uniref:erythrocyte binding like protein 1, putative n=1 Tax=Plasmodium sp. gorilla clade G2 TaxID=880535 RepID=UPI000D26DCF7|nr:erythrocyte binding like protein 1, putative [Plasmodium sp. gorilla clade G2]SOV20249.1 erythrocyte binding like protein 1, putative [Plasmodium sp. gorilla clade G2]
MDVTQNIKLLFLLFFLHCVSSKDQTTVKVKNYYKENESLHTHKKKSEELSNNEYGILHSAYKRIVGYAQRKLEDIFHATGENIKEKEDKNKDMLKSERMVLYQNNDGEQLENLIDPIKNLEEKNNLENYYDNKYDNIKFEVGNKYNHLKYMNTTNSDNDKRFNNYYFADNKFFVRDNIEQDENAFLNKSIIGNKDMEISKNYFEKNKFIDTYSSYECGKKIKEMKWICTDNQLISNNLCAPIRRIQLCIANIILFSEYKGEDIYKNNTINNKFKENILKAVKLESNLLVHKHNNEYNSKLCDDIRWSFSDYGDIIIGRDLIYKNNTDYIKEQFKKIFNNENNKVLNDEENIKLRKEWWEKYKEDIWEEMTKEHNDKFIEKCIYVVKDELQIVRWIEEWSKQFIDEKDYMLFNLRNTYNEMNIIHENDCKQYNKWIENRKKEWTFLSNEFNKMFPDKNVQIYISNIFKDYTENNVNMIFGMLDYEYNNICKDKPELLSIAKYDLKAPSVKPAKKYKSKDHEESDAFGCKTKISAVKKKWNCYNNKNVTKPDGVCGPPRRQQLCLGHIFMIQDGKEEQLKDHLNKAAYYEAMFLKEKLEKSDGDKICNGILGSYADIGDIVKGSDVWRDVNTNKLEDKFKKVFIVGDSRNKQKDIERDKWWEKERDLIWSSMSKHIPNGKTCKSHIDFESTPQLLRWLKEWGDEFCEEIDTEVKKLEQGCKNINCWERKCKNACSSYDNWIKERKNEYNLQSTKFDSDKKLKVYSTFYDKFQDSKAYLRQESKQCSKVEFNDETFTFPDKYKEACMRCIDPSSSKAVKPIKPNVVPIKESKKSDPPSLPDKSKNAPNSSNGGNDRNKEISKRDEGHGPNQVKEGEKKVPNIVPVVKKENEFTPNGRNGEEKEKSKVDQSPGVNSKDIKGEKAQGEVSEHSPKIEEKMESAESTPVVHRETESNQPSDSRDSEGKEASKGDQSPVNSEDIKNEEQEGEVSERSSEIEDNRESVPSTSVVNIQTESSQSTDSRDSEGKDSSKGDQSPPVISEDIKNEEKEGQVSERSTEIKDNRESVPSTSVVNIDTGSSQSSNSSDSDSTVLSGGESKDVNIPTSEGVKENEEGETEKDASSKSIEIDQASPEQNNHIDSSQNVIKDSNHQDKEIINSPSTEKNIEEIQHKTSDTDGHESKIESEIEPKESMEESSLNKREIENAARGDHKPESVESAEIPQSQIPNSHNGGTIVSESQVQDSSENTMSTESTHTDNKNFGTSVDIQPSLTDDEKTVSSVGDRDAEDRSNLNTDPEQIEKNKSSHSDKEDRSVSENEIQDPLGGAISIESTHTDNQDLKISVHNQPSVIENEKNGSSGSVGDNNDRSNLSTDTEQIENNTSSHSDIHHSNKEGSSGSESLTQDSPIDHLEGVTPSNIDMDPKQNEASLITPVDQVDSSMESELESGGKIGDLYKGDKQSENILNKDKDVVEIEKAPDSHANESNTHDEEDTRRGISDDSSTVHEIDSKENLHQESLISEKGRKEGNIKKEPGNEEDSSISISQETINDSEGRENIEDAKLSERGDDIESDIGNIVSVDPESTIISSPNGTEGIKSSEELKSKEYTSVDLNNRGENNQQENLVSNSPQLEPEREKLENADSSHETEVSSISEVGEASTRYHKENSETDEGEESGTNPEEGSVTDKEQESRTNHEEDSETDEGEERETNHEEGSVTDKEQESRKNHEGDNETGEVQQSLENNEASETHEEQSASEKIKLIEPTSNMVLPSTPLHESDKEKLEKHHDEPNTNGELTHTDQNTSQYRPSESEEVMTNKPDQMEMTSEPSSQYIEKGIDVIDTTKNQYIDEESNHIIPLVNKNSEGDPVTIPPTRTVMESVSLDSRNEQKVEENDDTHITDDKRKDDTIVNLSQNGLNEHGEMSNDSIKSETITESSLADDDQMIEGIDGKGSEKKNIIDAPQESSIEVGKQMEGHMSNVNTPEELSPVADESKLQEEKEGSKDDGDKRTVSKDTIGVEDPNRIDEHQNLEEVDVPSNNGNTNNTLEGRVDTEKKDEPSSKGTTNNSLDGRTDEGENEKLDENPESNSSNTISTEQIKLVKEKEIHETNELDTHNVEQEEIIRNEIPAERMDEENSTDNEKEQLSPEDEIINKGEKGNLEQNLNISSDTLENSAGKEKVKIEHTDSPEESDSDMEGIYKHKGIENQITEIETRSVEKHDIHIPENSKETQVDNYKADMEEEKDVNINQMIKESEKVSDISRDTTASHSEKPNDEELLVNVVDSKNAQNEGDSIQTIPDVSNSENEVNNDNTLSKDGFSEIEKPVSEIDENAKGLLNEERTEGDNVLVQNKIEHDIHNTEVIDQFKDKRDYEEDEKVNFVRLPEKNEEERSDVTKGIVPGSVEVIEKTSHEILDSHEINEEELKVSDDIEYPVGSDISGIDSETSGSVTIYQKPTDAFVENVYGLSQDLKSISENEKKIRMNEPKEKLQNLLGGMVHVLQNKNIDDDQSGRSSIPLYDKELVGDKNHLNDNSYNNNINNEVQCEKNCGRKENVSSFNDTVTLKDVKQNREDTEETKLIENEKIDNTKVKDGIHMTSYNKPSNILVHNYDDIKKEAIKNEEKKDTEQSKKEEKDVKNDDSENDNNNLSNYTKIKENIEKFYKYIKNILNLTDINNDIEKKDMQRYNLNNYTNIKGNMLFEYSKESDYDKNELFQRENISEYHNMNNNNKESSNIDNYYYRDVNKIREDIINLSKKKKKCINDTSSEYCESIIGLPILSSSISKDEIKYLCCSILYYCLIHFDNTTSEYYNCITNEINDPFYEIFREVTNISYYNGKWLLISEKDTSVMDEVDFMTEKNNDDYHLDREELEKNNSTFYLY